MRVIAGVLGGRNFESTAKTTHPMSEKMRGAIFNALGDIKDLSVLDVFAGSGAISFEAISRGAKNSLAIESNRHSQADIENNMIKLNIPRDQVKLVKAKLNSWLVSNDQKFDLVIADPPYNDLQLGSIGKLEGLLNNHGVLVLSLPPDSHNPLFEHLIQLSDKSYGDSKLVFYKNNQ